GIARHSLARQIQWPVAAPHSYPFPGTTQPWSHTPYQRSLASSSPNLRGNLEARANVRVTQRPGPETIAAAKPVTGEAIAAAPTPAFRARPVGPNCTGVGGERNCSA